MRIFIEELIIKAPLEHVFQTISTPEGFQKAVPHILRIEYLTEQKSGVGTKFKETRLMRGKEVSSVLEITELEENDFVRMVSEAGGTVWDSVFSVEAEEDGVHLQLKMTAIPGNFLARITLKMIGGMVKKGVAADMQKVKEYCEKT